MEQRSELEKNLANRLVLDVLNDIDKSMERVRPGRKIHAYNNLRTILWGQIELQKLEKPNTFDKCYTKDRARYDFLMLFLNKVFDFLTPSCVDANKRLNRLRLAVYSNPGDRNSVTFRKYLESRNYPLEKKQDDLDKANL